MVAARRYFQVMAQNNAWANERLISACEKLSDKAFVASRPGFFPSIMLTLNHVLVVDWFYVDALEGGTLGFAAWRDEAPCKTIRVLRAAQQAVDQRLIDYCDSLTEKKLGEAVRIHRGKRIQTERVDRLLLHIFQHQIHHRGQAHAMLSATQVKPPQLDEFFSADEASLRIPEFRQLGWTEADIWRGFTPPKSAQKSIARKKSATKKVVRSKTKRKTKKPA